MSKPNLDLFHCDIFAAVKQKTCTGMPEVMESAFPEAIFLNNPAEVLCHIVWAEKSATLIYTDIFEIISAVGLFEQSSVHLLLFFFCQDQFFHCRDEG